MGSVDVMEQKTAAYRLDRKSKYRFYLRILLDLFFDQIDQIDTSFSVTFVCFFEYLGIFQEFLGFSGFSNFGISDEVFKLAQNFVQGWIFPYFCVISWV